MPDETESPLIQSLITQRTKLLQQYSLLLTGYITAIEQNVHSDIEQASRGLQKTTILLEKIAPAIAPYLLPRDENSLQTLTQQISRKTEYARTILSQRSQEISEQLKGHKKPPPFDEKILARIVDIKT